MDDVNQLAAHIRDNGYYRIGVDGMSGVGKSTLAASLARLLGLSHINLDNYLDKGRGGFRDYLKYEAIKQNASELECFVIDGVCLLSVLEKAETSVDCLVYVKRMSYGCWADEADCEVQGDVEVYIKNQRNSPIGHFIEGAETSLGTLGLDEEIIRYCAKYKPHLKANIFYLRKDS
ncbi:hypothetical protein EST62_00960 [Chlorobaculum sp. 24CR]|nr:hypothetical protein EST62_00960 [Chlorobaculum sp. 24CR]